MTVELIHEELTKATIGAFFEVYNDKGFGFLENVYENAMAYELRRSGSTSSSRSRS